MESGAGDYCLLQLTENQTLSADQEYQPNICLHDFWTNPNFSIREDSILNNLQPERLLPVILIVTVIFISIS